MKDGKTVTGKPRPREGKARLQVLTAVVGCAGAGAHTSLAFTWHLTRIPALDRPSPLAATEPEPSCKGTGGQTLREVERSWRGLGVPARVHLFPSRQRRLEHWESERRNGAHPREARACENRCRSWKAWERKLAPVADSSG